MKRYILLFLFPLLFLIFLAVPVNALITEFDTVFNGVGYVTHNGGAGGDSSDRADKAFQLDDGSYLAIGDSITADGNKDLTIWKYTVDGDLDTTFGGGDGIVSYNNGNHADPEDDVHDAVMQEDGKIVIVGSTSNAGSIDLVVWRVLQNGSLDTSFGGGDGVFEHDNAGGGSGTDVGYGVDLTDEGKILIAGTSNTGFSYTPVLWQLTTAGELDASFGWAGGYWLLISLVGRIYDVDVLPDGKIIVTGDHSDDMLIARFDTDGTLDTTFGGGDGYTTHDNLTALDNGYSIISDENSGYLIGGTTGSPMSFSAIIWNIDNVGDLNTDFNSTGYVKYYTGQKNQINDIALDPNGDILATGYSDHSVDMTVWRYLSQGALDTSFNSTGVLTHNNAAGGTGIDRGWGITILENQSLLIAGESNGTNADMAVWLIGEFYQIENLDPSLDVETNEQNIESGTSNGINSLSTATIYVNGKIVAEVNIDLISDVDWSPVTAGMSMDDYSSFIAALGSAPGVQPETITLYVPRHIGHNFVGICPEAESLDMLNDQCSNLEYKSEDDSDVSIVTIDNVEYFKVDGLSGTGGFSSEGLEEDDNLVETGNNIFSSIVFGFVLITLSGVLRRGNKLQKDKSSNRILY